MRLQWAADARADLARIRTFNLARSEDWANRVETRLRSRAEALLRTPFLGRRIGATGLRALSVTDIQYVIVYLPGLRHVTIVSVHSTRESRDFE